MAEENNLDIAPETGTLGNEEIVDTTPEEGQVGFYDYKDDDGKEFKFDNREALDEHMRGSFYRKKKFTQTQQELGRDRKILDADRAKNDAEHLAYMNRKNEIDQIDNFLKGMPPQQYQQLLTWARGGHLRTPEGQQAPAPDPRVEKMLKEYETDKKSRSDEKAREDAHNSLSSLAGYNRDVVTAELDRLQNVTPGDDMREFFKLLHYAKIGMQSPASMEQTVVDKLERKSNVSTPMSQSSKPKGRGPKVYKDFDEAAKAAKEEIGL